MVYFIASHTNHEQIVRLVKTIKKSSPESKVVIHHNYSCSYLDPAAFEDLRSVHIIEDYVRVKWADYSQITMLTKCINWMLSNLQFNWMTFISGQDYPIQPLRKTEQFLAETDYDGFMGGWPIEKTKFQFRYFYRFYRYPKFPYHRSVASNLNKVFDKLNGAFHFSKVLPLILPVSRRIGFPRWKTPFSESFRCYKGSWWFTASYKCLRYIQEFVTNNPGFMKYYKRTIMPEESLILSIVKNNQELRIWNNDMRYIQWTKKQARPDTLTIQDYPNIVSSSKHFARKFDINVDSQILRNLDQIIFESPP